jgi:hypothetical protein
MKINWNDCVRNEEVLHTVKEQRNILHNINRRLSANCLLQHVNGGKIEAKMEELGRRERRRKWLLDDLKETRKYWMLKDKAPNHTLLRTCFERQYGQS